MTDKIDYDELIKQLENGEQRFFNTSIPNTLKVDLIRTLKQAKEDSEKFDVLEHLFNGGKIRHKSWIGNIHISMHDYVLVSYKGPAKSEISFSEFMRCYNEWRPYKEPTLEDQLIDGQLYMVEGRKIPLRWRRGVWCDDYGEVLGKHKPQTDDQGRLIMCGPMKNGDV